MTTTEATTWTSYGYWNTVFGTGSADQIAYEHDLVPDAPGACRSASIEAWINQAEAEAWEQGGHGGDLPAEWATFRADALTRLTAAAKKRVA